MSNPAPHERVAAEIRAGILDGRYPAGSHLPGTRTLAAELGAADKTVRSALRTLAAEGLVEVFPRAASRVLRPAPVVELTLTGEGRLAAMTGATQLAVESCAAPAGVAAALGGVEGMRVVRRRTLRGSGRRAWAVEEIYLPQAVADLTELLTSPASVDVFRVLAEHRLGETGFTSTWTARLATEQEARLLGEDSPVVHALARTAVHGSTPVAHETTVLRADRVRVTIAGGTADAGA